MFHFWEKKLPKWNILLFLDTYWWQTFKTSNNDQTDLQIRPRSSLVYLWHPLWTWEHYPFLRTAFVFHLGDFAHGGSRLWNDMICALTGRKYLILGNHDIKNLRQGFMNRFELVTQQMTIRVGGQHIVLNHNPFLCYGGSYRDIWQLFGHVHSGPLSHTGLDHPRLKMLFPLQYDVGVDNNNFRPVSFAEVKSS